jgi:hypothetical protein
MERRSTFGMTVQQLRELFDAGRGSVPRQGSDREVRAELLDLALSQNLPLDGQQVAQLPEAMGQLCQVMGRLTGDAIGEVLKNPSSDLKTIQRLKSFAKGKVEGAGSREEHDVYAALYYSAIGHALAFHHRRITRFSCADLAATYSRLSQETWIRPDLATLFRLARACCLEKSASE